MNAVIAALHNVDYKAVGLGDFGRPGNYLARQIARWSRQYRASETETIAAMDRLIDWLPPHSRRRAPLRSSTATTAWTIWSSTRPSRGLSACSTGISTIGDPLADFAYHVMSWRVTPELFRGLAGIDFAASGIPGRDRLCRRLLPPHRP